MFVLFNSSMMGVTSGAGTAKRSGCLSSPSVFIRVRVAQSLVFCKMLRNFLFVLFHLVIMLSVLQFTAYDNTFGLGIFKTVLRVFFFSVTDLKIPLFT
jgi:hypothetical protein